MASLFDQSGSLLALSFHFVERGSCRLEGDDLRSTTVLSQGDLLILSRGQAHTVSQAATSQVVDLAEAVQTEAYDGFYLNLDVCAEPGEACQLLCGVFLMDDMELNPLLLALPPLIHLRNISTGLAQRHWLDTMLRFLSDESRMQRSGRSFVIERLTEILWAEALRSYIDAYPDDLAGWFNGLNDPVILRALQCIHEEPGEDWTVQTLARRAGLSRSRFATRFTEVIGDSPKTYLTRWRMNVAARMLDVSTDGVGAIASSVGYRSETAFGKVFKHYMGKPPATWRRDRHATRVRGSSRTPGR